MNFKQTSMRFAIDLYNELKRLSDQHDMSVNQVIVIFIEHSLETLSRVSEGDQESLTLRRMLSTERINNGK